MRYLILGYVCFTALSFIALPALAKEEVSATTKKIERTARNLDQQLSRIDSEIRQSVLKIETLDADLDVLKKEEAQSKSKLEGELSSFNTSVMTMARLERMPQEALWMQDTLRMQHMRQGVLAMGRATLTKRIEDERVNLEDLAKVTARKNTTLETIQEEQATLIKRRKRLDTLLADQLKLLALSNKERATLLKESLTYANAPSINSLLEKRARSTVARKTAQPRAPYGKLPVEGEVLTRYNQKDPVGIASHGVTIEAKRSSPVSALSDGRVIYNGPFRDYGHLVILEHTPENHSLYAGMEKSLYVVGDFVRAGSTLGHMPSRGRPHLYIEVRKNGIAVNPKRWLSTKR